MSALDEVQDGRRIEKRLSIVAWATPIPQYLPRSPTLNKSSQVNQNGNSKRALFALAPQDQYFKPTCAVWGCV